MSERDGDDRPLDEEGGQAQAPGEAADEMVEEEPGTRDTHATAPEKEQPSMKTPATERTTAPQSPYTMRDVGIGFAVMAIGLLVVFMVPAVLF